MTTTDGNVEDYLVVFNKFADTIASNLSILEGQANPLGQLIVIIFLLAFVLGLIFLFIHIFRFGARRGRF